MEVLNLKRIGMLDWMLSMDLSYPELVMERGS